MKRRPRERRTPLILCAGLEAQESYEPARRRRACESEHATASSFEEQEVLLACGSCARGRQVHIASAGAVGGECSAIRACVRIRVRACAHASLPARASLLFSLHALAFMVCHGRWTETRVPVNFAQS